MNKTEYFAALSRELHFLSSDEQNDIIQEFESHLIDAAADRPDLTEEELVARLPSPKSIGERYRTEFGFGNEAGSSKSSQSTRSTMFGDFFRYTRRDYDEISGTAEGVQWVEITSAGCDITICTGTHLEFTIRGTWYDHTAPEIHEEGGIWKLNCGPDGETLEIQVPDSLEGIKLKTASGDISGDIPSCIFDGKSASGDVDLKTVGGNITLGTASGDIRLTGQLDEARIQTASGDIRLSGQIDEARVQSASGDIEIKLDQNIQPEIHGSTTSGDIRSNRGVVKEGIVGSTLSCPGGPRSLRLITISGDIRID